MLDLDGVIRDATLSNAVSQESAADWLGRAWVDTVDDIGGDKVRRTLAKGASRPSARSPSVSRAASSCRWSTPRSGLEAKPG
jgi:hypothetical protein